MAKKGRPGHPNPFFARVNQLIGQGMTRKQAAAQYKLEKLSTAVPKPKRSLKERFADDLTKATTRGRKFASGLTKKDIAESRQLLARTNKGRISKASKEFLKAFTGRTAQQLIDEAKASVEQIRAELNEVDARRHQLTLDLNTLSAIAAMSVNADPLDKYRGFDPGIDTSYTAAAIQVKWHDEATKKDAAENMLRSFYNTFEDCIMPRKRQRFANLVHGLTSIIRDEDEGFTNLPASLGQEMVAEIKASTKRQNPDPLGVDKEPSLNRSASALADEASSDEAKHARR